MWEIIRYESSMSGRWDEFVGNARNATFLFCRGYMDYHADRFEDHSLLALKNGKLRAILPANITSDGVLHSHQGLTYGGWILPKAHFDATDMLEMWNAWLEYCADQAIKAIEYKPLPWIYASRPSQEDIYALFRCGAVQDAVNLSSTICLGDNPGFDTMRRRHLRQATASGCVVVETDDCEAFMALVESCLRERHGVAPVHTAQEMRLLKDRFPERIRMFVARLDDEIHAGVMVYDTGIVAHGQYISSTAEGRRLNLLTPLFHKLIFETFADRRYFDFGISNEDNGRYLNGPLLHSKATMGATGVAYPRYMIKVSESIIRRP